MLCASPRPLVAARCSQRAPLLRSPGTTTQVFAGVALTFGMLLYYQRSLPYTEKAYLHIGYAASIVLFIFLLFALSVRGSAPRVRA